MSKNKKSQEAKNEVVEIKENVNLSQPTNDNKENLKNDKKSKDKTKDVKKSDKNKKDNKNKKKDKKEKGKLKRKTKETFSELKKVTWPSFADVCKKTGVVLVVVLVFAVVIFGIDYCLGLLMGLLRK